MSIFPLFFIRHNSATRRNNASEMREGARHVDNVHCFNTLQQRNAPVRYKSSLVQRERFMHNKHTLVTYTRHDVHKKKIVSQENLVRYKFRIFFIGEDIRV